MHACTQAESDALDVLVQSSTRSSISVKHELGSPSPIVVRRSSGDSEVVS